MSGWRLRGSDRHDHRAHSFLAAVMPNPLPPPLLGYRRCASVGRTRPCSGTAGMQRMARRFR